MTRKPSSLAVAAVAILLSASSSFAVDWPTEPDSVSTPGLARNLSMDVICNTKWGTDARYVTSDMKTQVIESYHFDVKACPLTTLKGKKVHRVEIDHLIPRSLGGADDVKNLWPECYEPVNKDKSKQADGAHKKDRVEDELHRRVCAARSTELLKSYQDKIKTDWIALYHEIYGND